MVPDGLGVGSGEYVEFSWCLRCGQIQGEFPIPQSVIDGAFAAPDEDDDFVVTDPRPVLRQVGGMSVVNGDADMDTLRGT